MAELPLYERMVTDLGRPEDKPCVLILAHSHTRGVSGAVFFLLEVFVLALGPVTLHVFKE